MNNFPQQWPNPAFPSTCFVQQQQPTLYNGIFQQGSCFQPAYLPPFPMPPFHALSDALNMISPANLRLNVDSELVRRPVTARRFKPQQKHEKLDSDLEIQKWLEQRRLRYPSSNRPPSAMTAQNQELSILETKLRKKICILSGSAKRTQVKVLQMKELCRTLAGSQREKRRFPIERKEMIDALVDEEESRLPQKPNLSKDEIKQEISVIQQKLKENHPKEFFRNRAEGSEAPELGKGQKKRMKKKLKMLKGWLEGEKEAPKAKQDGDGHYSEMVKTLKRQQDQMGQLIELSFDYKHNPVNYHHKADTLLTNLLMDQIYRERQYILQAIRFIVKENFFCEPEFELISEEEVLSESKVDSAEEDEEDGEVQ